MADNIFEANQLIFYTVNNILPPFDPFCWSVNMDIFFRIIFCFEFLHLLKNEWWSRKPEKKRISVSAM